MLNKNGKPLHLLETKADADNWLSVSQIAKTIERSPGWVSRQATKVGVPSILKGSGQTRHIPHHVADKIMDIARQQQGPTKTKAPAPISSTEGGGAKDAQVTIAEAASALGIPVARVSSWVKRKKINSLLDAQRRRIISLREAAQYSRLLQQGDTKNPVSNQDPSPISASLNSLSAEERVRILENALAYASSTELGDLKKKILQKHQKDRSMYR